MGDHCVQSSEKKLDEYLTITWVELLIKKKQLNEFKNKQKFEQEVAAKKDNCDATKFKRVTLTILLPIKYDRRLKKECAK